MFAATILSLLLPVLVTCTNEGNIHLLEEEIAAAIRSCSYLNNSKNQHRQRRSNDEHSRIDGNTKERANQYYHERRNTSQLNQNQIHILNGTDYDYVGYGAGDVGEKYIKSIPRPTLGNNSKSSNDISLHRTKRAKTLLHEDNNQCLSQCVFANIQVVDSRGIPREMELWNKIQTSVNSQQSKSLIKDQLHACFQELESESEDNGCSYSNKLERCLMLRLSDRSIDVYEN